MMRLQCLILLNTLLIEVRDNHGYSREGNDGSSANNSDCLVVKRPRYNFTVALFLAQAEEMQYVVNAYNAFTT